jgi:hypothetical protein
MKPPKSLRIDDDLFHMRCWTVGKAASGSPYVDVKFDTIPPTDDDPDYSENPDILRKAAAWLVKAADWLEKEQGR